MNLIKIGLFDFLRNSTRKTFLRGVLGHTEEPLPWAHSDEYVAEAIAKLVGADASEVICMNSLTVNLHVFLVPVFIYFIYFYYIISISSNCEFVSFSVTAQTYH